MVPPVSRTLVKENYSSLQQTIQVMNLPFKVGDQMIEPPASFVNVPQDKWVENIHDPMIPYFEWYGFGRNRAGARAKGQVNPTGPQTSSMPTSRMRVSFWDHFEIEEFVEKNLKHDLLVQNNNFDGRWCFMTCSYEDHLAWTARISQSKAVEFAIDHRIEKHVESWCLENCGTFDIISNSSTYGTQYPVRVYIRDSDEAMFFKLRWSGIDVERELA